MSAEVDLAKELCRLLPYTIGICQEIVQDFQEKEPETVTFESDGSSLTVSPVEPPYKRQLEAINFTICYNRTVFANRGLHIYL